MDESRGGQLVYRKDSGLLKFKVMMLGDAGVGKTSIARRFTDENFMQTYIHTIGIDFLEKTIQCKPESEDEDPVDVKLQIWDTAGQERYYILTQVSGMYSIRMGQKHSFFRKEMEFWVIIGFKTLYFS